MRFVVLAAIALTLFGLLAYPLLTNQVTFQSDLGRYHLPVRDFYQKCLHNGEDPHWCPRLFCGFDLHGEGQGGFDHPWHRLLYTFVPLVPAFNIEVFVNFPILCLGMCLFLRRHHFSRESSFVGALWFTFSGFTIPHYCHTNAIAIIAHIPWLLWATDIQFTTDSTRQRCAATSFLALLTGSQILLGYPQYVMFSGITECLYVCFLMAQHRRWSALPWWLAAKIIGVMVGGAQLLPTYQALQLSPRMGYDKHFRGMGSLPPQMFLQPLTPTMFNEFMQMNEYTVYAGMLATFAALWWIASRPAKTDFTLGRWAFMLVVLSLVLAVGKHSPLYSTYLKLPVVGLFRFPCRFLVLFHLASAIIVACFIERMNRLADRPWSIRAICFGLIVPALAFVLPVNAHDISGPQSAGAENWNFCAVGAITFAGFYIAVVLWLLLFAINASWQFMVVPLYVVAFADLAYFNFRTLDLPPLHRIGVTPTNTYQFVNWNKFLDKETRPPQPGPGRVDVPDSLGNALMIRGDNLARGYVGLSPPKTLDDTQPPAQRLAGTTWQFDGAVWKQIDGLPLARMLTDVRVSSDPRNDIDSMDIAKTAVVESPLELEPGPPGIANISEERPGRIVTGTSAPTKQLLVLAYSFHPNWRAAIDGNPAPILRVNGDFQGIVVPAGGHRIVLTFEPTWRTWGRWLSFVGLGISVAILLLGWLLDIFRRLSLR